MIAIKVQVAFKYTKTDKEATLTGKFQIPSLGMLEVDLSGKDAQGEVSLELEVENNDMKFRGRAASTDIIEASAEAYINAVNAIASRADRGRQREVIGRPGAGA